jgi:anionic cell wall polymer biosynthesis LytR-Cps2A-Psr (LCP) family protein
VAETVESLSGIHPQYIFVSSFVGLENMVDRLGGVTVDVDRPMHDLAFSGTDFDPGTYHFTGGQALAFTRDRHLAGGDFTRSFDQGVLLEAVLRQLLSKVKETGATEWALRIFLEEAITEASPAEVFRLGRLAMAMDPSKVSNLVLPGGVGAAGAASIVVLDRSAADAIFDEIRSDATLKSPPPPIPNI